MLSTDKKEGPSESIHSKEQQLVSAQAVSESKSEPILPTIDAGSTIISHLRAMGNLIQALDLRDLFDDLRFQRDKTDPILFWG